MRIDEKRFFEGTCKKCKQYTGDKPTFGKCLGDRMYSCALGIMGRQWRGGCMDATT